MSQTFCLNVVSLQKLSPFTSLQVKSDYPGIPVLTRMGIGWAQEVIEYLDKSAASFLPFHHLFSRYKIVGIPEEVQKVDDRVVIYCILCRLSYIFTILACLNICQFI